MNSFSLNSLLCPNQFGIKIKRIYHLLGTLFIAFNLLNLTVSRLEAATLEVCNSGCEFSSIKSAIQEANIGDTVLVNNGTYQEQISFSGITVQSVNGPDTTIIDANLTKSQTGGTVVNVACSGNDCDSGLGVLDGFTIKGGNSSSSPGGIGANGAIINNCIIENNKGKDGGGIRHGGATNDTGVTITNCIIRNNTARSGAGIAVLADAGPTLIENSTITGNTATREGGGGLRIFKNFTTIRNTTITGNIVDSELTASAGQGGGISIGAATVTLENSTVADNTATRIVGGNGGGVWLSGTLNLESSPVSGNQAIGTSEASGLGGGIFCNEGATLNNTGSLISGNSASTDGDDIFCARNNCNCPTESTTTPTPTPTPTPSPAPTPTPTRISTFPREVIINHCCPNVRI